MTINPGSNTLDVLAGLGGGRFANPVTLPTASPAQVVRVADFTGNGLDDLAVLTADGVSIYLGNGQGGFSAADHLRGAVGIRRADRRRPHRQRQARPPGRRRLRRRAGPAWATATAPSSPTTTPIRRVELAVADLTGNGSKDVIYADQGLDRVVVDYGGRQFRPCWPISPPACLHPGAVALADLNGDGIPDLIVANSGSNNVLIYPGLGNGQFGPAINGGHGYFVGTNPVGITVANLTGALPDLVVADKGSNQVSILLNQSQHGGNDLVFGGPAAQFRRLGAGLHGGRQLHRRRLPRHSGHQ